MFDAHFQRLHTAALGSPMRTPWLAAVQLWKDVNRANLLMRASAMAYMTLGSIVPSLAAIFAIISIFEPLANPGAVWFTWFRRFVVANLAPDAGEQIVIYIEKFLANLNVAAIGVSGFVGLMFVLILLMRNVEQALDEIWLIPNVRPMVKRFLFFWTFVTLGTATTTIVLGYVSQFNLAQLLPFGSSAADTGWTGAFVSMAATFVFFSFLYKIGPNCYVPVRAAVVGGAVAAVLLRTANFGYSLYASNSDTYKNIYGALAAVPLFLLWLYIGWLVFLFGAIVAWRVHQGFAISKAENDRDPTKADTCAEYERNVQVRALMPLFCILAVHERFDRREGIGITGREIVETLDLPASWVKEGLRAAEDLGYIVLGKPAATQGFGDIDPLDMKAFPTMPGESVDVRDLAAKLTHEARAWLRERGSRVQLVDLLRRFAEPIFTPKPRRGLLDVLHEATE